MKVYLENLPNTNGNYEGAIEISSVTSKNPNQQPVIRIETARIPFITNIFIPFLDSLNWHSKKRLDFQDWKNILKLREHGHHLSENGTKVIDLILSQMNNNRLSTKRSKLVIDRALLDSNINKLLEGPSNFEVKEDGRILIKSLNKYYSNHVKIRVELLDESGDIIRPFDSMADCVKYLNVTSMTVSKRLQGKPFLFNNKLVSLKKLL